MKTKVIYSLIAAAAMTSVMVGCQPQNEPVPSKDWDNTTYLFTSADEAQSNTFYKPAVGFVGDPMPMYDPVAGNFKIGYLQEFRPNGSTYHNIWGVETKDGVNYTSLDALITTGGITDQDAALGTGAVIYNEEDKLYYYFYTAHKNVMYDNDSREVIMYATSSDFKTWTKNRLFQLKGSDNGYSSEDFRDPCIFRTEDKVYHMIVVTVNSSNKGCLVEYTSTDLKEWKHKGQFMTCMWDRFYECPDIFKMGDWWYLVYSEKHVAIRKVQYFKGKTLEDLADCTYHDAGVWPDSHEGILDSRGFYAGKTAFDGENRYIWGWCPTREGNDNTKTGDSNYEPQWAGSLVCHRLIQHKDGTLTLGAVPALAEKYSESVTLKEMRKEENNTLYNRLDRHNHISFTAVADSKDAQFGISLCHGTELYSKMDSSVYYAIQILPEEGTYGIKFSQERSEVGICPGVDSYRMPIPEDLTYKVDLYTDNSVVVVYINDEICWTNRIYGWQKNCWGLETYQGNVEFKDIKVTKY